MGLEKTGKSMKMRQAAKIVENLAANRPLRYRGDTIQRAHRVVDHHGDRSMRGLLARIRGVLGPLGFFGWQMDARLRLLEDGRCDD